MKYLVKYQGPDTEIEAVPDDFEFQGALYLYDNFSEARGTVVRYLRGEANAFTLAGRKFRQMKKHQVPRRVGS